MASTAIRERRRTLRCLNVLVRQTVQMKIKIGSLLMEAEVSYSKQRLHKAGYFRELLATSPNIDEGLRSSLRLWPRDCSTVAKNRECLGVFLERDPLLLQHAKRLMSIPANGPITALTWALEIGELQRFSSIKKVISYCGLCGAEKISGCCRLLGEEDGSSFLRMSPQSGSRKGQIKAPKQAEGEINYAS